MEMMLDTPVASDLPTGLPVFTMEDAHKLFTEGFPTIPKNFRHILDIDAAPQGVVDSWGEKEMYPTFREWFDRYCTWQTVVPLGQFKTLYRTLAHKMTNFVYHRRLGVVFVTLTPGGHYNLMSLLYTLETLNKGIPPITTENTNLPYWYANPGSYTSAQDKFMIEGMGMYQSSCGDDVYRHREFRMNAQEKMAFSMHYIHEADR